MALTSHWDMGEDMWKASYTKTISLLARLIQASTEVNAWILDPFSGSATTGIAANLLGRNYLGLGERGRVSEYE